MAHDVPLAVMPLAAELSYPHREGCCLRTDTAAALSKSEKLQVTAVEGTDRR